MQQTTLTSKGQITIPKFVRDSLALLVGDQIEFVLTDTKQVFLRPVTKLVDEVYGLLYQAERPAFGIDEMDALLKDKIRSDYK